MIRDFNTNGFEKRKTQNVFNEKLKNRFHIFRFPFIAVFLCVSAASFGCRSAPIDLRSLAPAGALVYLETNDLGKTLEALTESRAFEELARNKTDFSRLENVQFAVAVTGFESSEQQISGEQSILNFKPRFVAIADTHARWNATAVSAAETQIGRVARGAFGDDVKLEKSEKSGAKFFVWTNVRDGRRIFAAVAGGVIYAGNDESVLDECLRIRSGAAESLSKNERLERARQTANGNQNIAFGWISEKGVAQIANFAAVSFAVGATESDDARSFIARAAPQIFQQTFGEIVWTAEKTARGIEDKTTISTTNEAAAVFRETFKSAPPISPIDAAEFLPADVFSVTRYNLENPQTAWRSLLFVAAKRADERDAKILALASNGLLASYGVDDAETFLSAADSEILTARFDADGEKSVSIAAVKNASKIKKSIGEINFQPQPEKRGNAEIWKSDDGELAAAFVGNKLILGDAESVFKCLDAKIGGRNFTGNQLFQKFNESRAVAVTVAKDADAAEKIVALLGEAKDENKKTAIVYLTETEFTETGVRRRSVSAFGLIGTILELAGD